MHGSKRGERSFSLLPDYIQRKGGDKEGRGCSWRGLMTARADRARPDTGNISVCLSCLAKKLRL